MADADVHIICSRRSAHVLKR